MMGHTDENTMGIKIEALSSGWIKKKKKTGSLQSKGVILYGSFQQIAWLDYWTDETCV